MAPENKILPVYSNAWHGANREFAIVVSRLRRLFVTATLAGCVVAGLAACAKLPDTSIAETGDGAAVGEAIEEGAGDAGNKPAVETGEEGRADGLAEVAAVDGDDRDAESDAVADAGSDKRNKLEYKTRPDEQLLILEVRLKRYILTDGMFGYIEGGGLLLPLGEFARALEFNIAVDTSNGRADGWYMDQDRLFALDILSGTVVIDGRKQEYDRGLVELHREDIFVDTRLLSQWFPADVEFDLSNLLVRVKSREPLPLEQRAEREQRRGVAMARKKREEAEYETIDAPYQWVDWPMVNFSSSAGYTKTAAGDGDITGNYNLLAVGDLMKMGSKLFVSGNQDRGVSLVRLEMGRKDPEGQLLGPLGATEYSFGDIVTPAHDDIARSRLGRGAQISSFPLERASDFDSINLVGELPLGWEVELYRNEILLEFRGSRADGRYEFDEVPLLFGLNVLTMKFFGPQGQYREETRRVLVGQGQVEPGEFNYRLAVTQQDEYLIPVQDDTVSTANSELQGELRAITEAEYGLNKNFSVAGGASSIALPDGRHNYGKLGMRFGWRNLYSRFDIIGDSMGGGAARAGAQLSMPLNLSLLLEHIELRDFISEEFPEEIDPTLRVSKLGFNGVIPFGSLLRVPFNITAEHETAESGATETEVKNRLSTSISRVSFSNWLLWRRTKGAISDTTNAEGALLVGGHLYRTALRGELQYAIEPVSELTRGILSVERHFGAKTTGRVSADRTFSGQEVTTLSAALSHRFDIAALGVNGSWGDDGSASALLTLSFAFGREPRTGDWGMYSDAVADNGAVSARVFLDNDLDGKYGPDDTPVEGAMFDTGRGLIRETTNEDGVLLLTDLPAWRNVDVVIPPQGLEDPYWSPKSDGFTVRTRPGKASIVDFPIIVTGEIDGMVYARQGGAMLEVADVAMELVDAEGNTVAQTRSAFDGFFLFELVKPGRYTVQVSREQLQRLGLVATDTKTVEILGEGTIASGLQFTLTSATGL
ncbi:MAG: carboxypeptidase regulatory-like domain-containing protein [Proteobacteria bacterium]|nr:carboxypeptidase regulatory-like domain-containing protein [Pseudomonadota bacterium]